MQRSFFALCGLSCAAAALTFGACSGLDPLTPPSSSASSSSSSSGVGGMGGAGGAGGMGGMGGGLMCPSPLISKGPWSLRMKEDTVTVRWEACAPGSKSGLIVTPEAGGADMTIASTETPHVVADTNRAVLAPDAEPDWAGTFYMHEAIVQGLTPSTCYSYRLEADAERKGRFCTSKISGDPIRFLSIGDTNPGLGPDAAQILSHVVPKGFDFTIHGGDVQYYASGLETWASWFPVMQPMLSQGAFFPAVGNHESEKPNEIEDYELRFFGNAGFDGTDKYYRFQSGGVWFFSLNTESPIGLASPQYGWLEKELADAAATPGYRFSVVYFHRPLVTCGDTPEDPATRAQLEPLFTQYKVPLVIQAHMHGYERFELGAITYITSAGGGGLIGDPNKATDRPECASRVAAGGYHFGVVFDVDATTIRGEVIDLNGKTRDQFSKPVP